MTKVALYPGTFDPVTNGHSDIIERATRLFDTVVVAVASNPGKQPLFSLDERIELVTAALDGRPGVKVVGFSDLLIHCAQREGASVILRGLRAVSDFEFEFQMASMNRRLDPAVETLFMVPAEQNTFISASLVKEIAAHGGDVSGFLHSAVAAALARKIG